MVDDDEFDLENDDFFSEVFRSIPDSELVDPSDSEHSIEYDCQLKCNVIAALTENAKQSASSNKRQKRENVENSAVNSSCVKNLRLESNMSRTALVSSTPLPYIDNSLKVGINCSLIDQKKTCSNSLRPNMQQVILNKSCHLDRISFFSEIFTGFPFATKRIFAGPYGLVPATQDESLVDQPCFSGDTKKSLKIEHQNIVSFQNNPEALECVSWEKLKADVFSSLKMCSNPQIFNINQILLEASKRKLPKYMVIPIFCTLIKKVNAENKYIDSVFIDGTGEINGRIDKEILEKYGKEIVKGSAVILKNVKCLLNVILVKCENLVSIYEADGTVNCVEDLLSVFKGSLEIDGVTSEQLMPVKTGTVDFLRSCGTASSDICQGHKVPLKTVNSNYKDTFKSSSAKMNNSHVSTSIPKAESNHLNAENQTTSENENLDTNGCMDDFDELLGNLDETSFLAA